MSGEGNKGRGDEVVAPNTHICHRLWLMILVAPTVQHWFLRSTVVPMTLVDMCCTSLHVLRFQHLDHTDQLTLIYFNY